MIPAAVAQGLVAERLRTMCWRELAQELGVGKRQIARWVGCEHDLQDSTFDNLCCKLGYHPGDVYEEWWAC